MTDACAAVFVVGALHLDVVVDAPRLPALDETLMGHSVAYRFGGKGGNQALAAARMGAEVAMAGRVGQDSFADQVLSVLHTSGIDHSQVLPAPGATGMSVAIVDTQGEYGAVVVSGVNQSIDPADVKLGKAQVILLQNEISEAVNLSVAQAMPESAMLILNAAPARPTSSELLAQVDLLVVNRVEAGQMLGSEPEDLSEAAEHLAALGPNSVILTAGKSGAALHHGGATEWIHPPQQARGSAHGAGDAFVGTLAAEIALGQDLPSAAQFAAGAAAHFVHTLPEHRQSITRQDVQRWLKPL